MENHQDLQEEGKERKLLAQGQGSGRELAVNLNPLQSRFQAKEAQDAWWQGRRELWGSRFQMNCGLPGQELSIPSQEVCRQRMDREAGKGSPGSGPSQICSSELSQAPTSPGKSPSWLLATEGCHQMKLQEVATPTRGIHLLPECFPLQTSPAP